ncbi:MAG: flagellar export protein FliJ [Planctomycetes bacterium]|nr:flagellar export protein FliJ [Planctomycetota bacterium]
MSKFRFRLATLRKLREIRRDELRTKLAEASRATQMLDEQIMAVGSELTNLQSEQRAAIAGSADVNVLLETQRYQAILRAQQSTMQDQAGILKAEVERRRQAVVEADKEVRLLEKLNERQRNEHQKQMQRAEVKELDEIASSRRKVSDVWAQ